MTPTICDLESRIPPAACPNADEVSDLALAIGSRTGSTGDRGLVLDGVIISSPMIGAEFETTV